MNRYSEIKPTYQTFVWFLLFRIYLYRLQLHMYLSSIMCNIVYGKHFLCNLDKCNTCMKQTNELYTVSPCLILSYFKLTVNSKQSRLPQNKFCLPTASLNVLFNFAIHFTTLWFAIALKRWSHYFYSLNRLLLPNLRSILHCVITLTSVISRLLIIVNHCA